MAPRTAQQRKRDTLDLLDARGADIWVASSSPAGKVHLVPLSFAWDGTDLFVAIAAGSVTAKNASDTHRVRIGLGQTRDVVMIDATVESSFPTADADAAVADRYAEQAGWDSRADADFTFLTLRPTRVQAWRESDEIAGRTLMRNGAWLL
jgi:general stress protein 26